MSNVDLAGGSTYILPSNGLANSQLLDRLGNTGIDPSSPSVGAGSAAGVTDVPGLAPGLSFGAIMESLSGIMPKISGDQLDALVASFTQKMKDTSDASASDRIRNESKIKQAAIELKKAKTDEAIKKQAEAEAKLKDASVFDKIKLAFQYLGAILTIAAGILMMATTSETGLGAIGGACMVMSGLCMLTMAVDSTVQIAQQDEGKGDLGMFGMMCKSIAKSRGMSDADAEKVGQKGSMGASIALGAASAIFGLAGGVAGIGAAAGVGMGDGAALASTADAAASTGETAADGGLQAVDESGNAMSTASGLAEDGTVTEDLGSEGASAEETTSQEAEQLGSRASRLSETQTKMIQITGDITDLGGDAAGAGGGAADIGSGVDNYDASELQVDAKNAQADTKRFEAIQKSCDDLIDLMMKQMKDAGAAFNQMLDDVVEAANDRASTLSHMRFSA